MFIYEKAMQLATNNIKVHEGLRLKPYDDKTGQKDSGDSGGKITIGWGRNIEGVGITLEEAEMLLTADIANSTHEALSAFGCFASLCEQRQAVLIEMVFNMGITRFLRFKKMRAALNSPEIDFDEVSDEMLDSKWHRDFKQIALRSGRPLSTARSSRLALAMREGKITSPWWQ